MVPWRSFSVLWDKKKWQNPENFPLPGLKIFDTRNLWKHRMVLLRFYRYSETIFSNGVQWYPLLMHKFLRYTKLSEKTKSSPTSFFGPVWQKVFDGKRWYPLCDAQIFRYLKVSDTPKCSPTKYFGTVGHKVFDKTVKLPLSFAWKNSIPEFFWNTEGFFYESYRHCEAKSFQRNLVLSASYAYNFSLPNTFWWTEVFLNEFFWY